MDRRSGPLRALRRRERLRLAGLLALPLAFLAAFFAWPVANIVGEGLRTDRGWDLHGLGEVLGDPALRHVAWFTLWQALASTALTVGLADAPESRADRREAIGALHDEMGEALFRDRLRAADPEAEARIAPGDRQRLLRALEVFEASGKPLSAWQAETAPALASGDWRGFVVDVPREALYARCDARLDAMAGIEAADEIKAIARRIAIHRCQRALLAIHGGDAKLQPATAQSPEEGRQVEDGDSTLFLALQKHRFHAEIDFTDIMAASQQVGPELGDLLVAARGDGRNDRSAAPGSP